MSPDPQPDISNNAYSLQAMQHLAYARWCFEHKTVAFFCWEKPHTCHCGGEAYWYVGKFKPTCNPCVYSGHA
jgi:hypothetical protein